MPASDRAQQGFAGGAVDAAGEVFSTNLWIKVCISCKFGR